MSLAIEGYGSFIERSTNGGVSWITMAEVIRIVGPGTKNTAIDVTHLQSPSNSKEFARGMLDAGEIKLDLNFTSVEWLALQGMFPTLNPGGTANNPMFRITFSTGNRSVGAGFITDIEPTTSPDDKITKTVTIKCDGLWVHT
jgi:hypothetical protein